MLDARMHRVGGTHHTPGGSPFCESLLESQPLNTVSNDSIVSECLDSRVVGLLKKTILPRVTAGAYRLA